MRLGKFILSQGHCGESPIFTSYLFKNFIALRID